MAPGDKKPASGSKTNRPGNRPAGKDSGKDSVRGSGKGSGKAGQRGKSASGIKAARAVAATKKPKPWGTIAAVVVVLALAGSIFGYAYSRIDARNAAAEAKEQQRVEREQRLAPYTAIQRKWAPTQNNPDPSKKIDGVTIKNYEAGKHVNPTQRVAYDQSPPFGGPHDGFWADCSGVVYPEAVRSENMVHGLEHGAVWIAYNPDQVSGQALSRLKDRVIEQPFTMMSPYPGLKSGLSLQAWGHQLQLDDPNDKRIDQFIGALRRNQNTYPEIGASCDALGPGQFDTANPPPFDGSDPGQDAVPMDGGQKANEDVSGMGGAG